MPIQHLLLLGAAFLLALGAAFFSWPRSTPGVPAIGASLGWLAFACFVAAGFAV